MMAERDSIEFLLCRVRAADPTSLASYKLLDMLFKIVQWTAFASLMRVIGIKAPNWKLQVLGWVLLILVLLFVCRAVIRVLNGIYRPSAFKTKLDRAYAYTISLIAFSMVFFWIEQQFVLAASLIVSYYLNK